MNHTHSLYYRLLNFVPHLEPYFGIFYLPQADLLPTLIAHSNTLWNQLLYSALCRNPLLWCCHNSFISLYITSTSFIHTATKDKTLLSFWMYNLSLYSYVTFSSFIHLFIDTLSITWLDSCELHYDKYPNAGISLIHWFQPIYPVLMSQRAHPLFSSSSSVVSSLTLTYFIYFQVCLHMMRQS